MTLPVSSYEELLARVRSLTSETIQLRREITSSLSDHNGAPGSGGALSADTDHDDLIKSHAALRQRMTSSGEDLGREATVSRIEGNSSRGPEPGKMFDEKEIEELYDEFLNLDGNVFPEADEDINKLECDDVNLNFIRKLPVLRNNNFIGDTSGVSLDNSNATNRLDLLNENFITLSPYDKNSENFSDLRTSGEKPPRSALLFDKKEDEIDNELKEIDEKLTSPDVQPEKKSFHRSGWPFDSLGLWHSGPSSLNLGQTSHNHAPQQDLTSSLAYSTFEPQHTSTFSSSSKRTYSHQQLGAKVEMVYSLLSMLDTDNREDMSKTFLAMSSSPESCHAMRQSGCLPLLIQLIHSSELNKEVRRRAAEALHNVVHAQTDEKRRRREVRVLKLLQQTREYCDDLKSTCTTEVSHLEESEKHPINAIGTLMKYSFDAEHRQAICILGGLHAIAELIQVDHEAHGSVNDDSLCITLRRYAGMSLTNLTFGDGKNKALLCSFNKFMRALVDQLKSPSEDLRQVTASVLRNLSWRADSESKQSLRNVGAVTALTVSAMEAKKESTLKSILSALWNLSAHCSLNKIDICSVPGALAFLVKMLRYKSSSNTLAIVENAGGVLRNISTYIAVREDYRQILRDNNCFEVLLEQLKSPSLTIVSNACGTLWNLSARCPEDQRKLWEMGATSMLRSLVQSKHKMISMGSSAALKNLLAANPNENLLAHLDSTAKSLGLQNLPTLFVRKKRALEQELNITLADTCDNIDCTGSPTHTNLPPGKPEEKMAGGPVRSDSHDSVQSTQSDSVYERINQIAVKNAENLLENKTGALHQSLDEKSLPRKVEDQKLIRRYKTSMIPTPTFKKMNQDRINEKTKEETVAEDAETVVETKEKTKKGIPVLESRLKSKMVRSSESSDNSSALSQSSKESLVKSKESDCFDAREVEECGRMAEADLDFGDRKSRDSNCSAQEVEDQGDNFNAKAEPEVESEREPNANLSDALNENSEKTETGYGNNLPEQLEGRKAETTEDNSTEEVSSNDSNERTLIPRTRNVDEIPLERADAEGTTRTDHVERFSESPAAGKDEPEKKVPSEDSKAPSGCIFPKFKVGSPITDSRVLQMEAKKICQEIKKHQDFEMGCSLTSEVSLISCSSFLDTGDYSLFDSSTEPGDFDDSDSLLAKSAFRVKGCLFRKPATPQPESVSLPSLGSFKNEPIEALDLDNSVLSVASITSEIAETYQKDPEIYNTYTKTYKNDTENDFLEETLADATLVSNDNVTLQADSPHNNAEPFDEDNSLHSQEDLPLDTENDDVAERIKKKLTPKEKRKTFHERYRTYTIRDFKGCNKGSVDLNGQGMAAGARGSELGNGYPVSSIVEHSLDPGNEEHEDHERQNGASIFSKNETFQFSKSFDNERGVVPGFVFDSRSLNDLLSVGPAERKELVDNAKLVVFSLKTAVHDFEPISDSETDEFHKSLDIDTATYSKHNRDRSLGKFSSEQLEYLQQYKEHPVEEEGEKKGARISKPTDNPEEKLEEIPKGIRGKRKPLYPSPQKHLQRPSGSSPDPVKKPPPTPRTETKSLPPDPSASPTLHREGTFTKESGSPVKNETKIEKGIPVLSRNPTKPIARSRPATAATNVKRTGENQVSRIGRPLSAYASKNTERRAESISSQRRPFSAETANRSGGDGAAPTRRPASTGLTSPKLRISSSNQNIRAGSSPGGSSSKSKQTLQSSKSQSDASLHLVAHKDKVPAGKLKEPKKEVTSKIAGLWRKVEETKQKNKYVKDNRVWIGPEKKAENPDEVLVIEQEEILDIPTRKIVHSFTSQTLVDDTSDYNSQERDSRVSRNYSHVAGPADRVNRNERRKIISAIVPPYNYSPPVTEQVIPATVKRVDSFHKDSLKVTAV